MNQTKYKNFQEIQSSLNDNALMQSFETARPNRPNGLNDLFGDVSKFFTNTGKSAENANKITEKVEKGLDKSAPYLIVFGAIIGVMALSQTVKNVQEIQKNA